MKLKYKRSYHSDLILQYKLGSLPAHLLDEIPSSTLHNWKHRDLSLLWGKPLSDSDIKLHKAIASKRSFTRICRALYIAFAAYDAVLHSLPNKRKLLLKSKEVILASVEKISSLISRKKALSLFNISAQQFFAWKSKTLCSSPLSLCFKKHPLQVSMDELSKIKRYFQKYPLWSAKAVYYQMMKEKAAFLSLSSFYKYSRLLGLNRPAPASRRKKHSLGIRASAPRKIIHMDVTVFRPLDNSKVYIYLIVDNFSRCILSWKASLTLSGELCMENLKEAVVKHRLFNSSVDLIVDGGSENNCVPVNEFVFENGLNKLVAQKDILFSNSMVEAAHKHLKYQYLFQKDLYSFEDVVRYMEFSVMDHSNKPHGALFGLTPLEVLNGAVPCKDMFSEDIRRSRMKRVEWNRIGCGRC